MKNKSIVAGIWNILCGCMAVRNLAQSKEAPGHAEVSAYAAVVCQNDHAESVSADSVEPTLEKLRMLRNRLAKQATLTESGLTSSVVKAIAIFDLLQDDLEKDYITTEEAQSKAGLTLLALNAVQAKLA